MDSAKQNHKNSIHKKQAKTLWIVVVATMAVIIALWVLLFYPKTLEVAEQKANKETFTNFKTRIEETLNIFKKENKNISSDQSTPDIKELRQQVFGDTVYRATE